MAIKKLANATRTDALTAPVVNAVDDETLREEVALIVAATGRACTEETVPATAAATDASVSSALWRRAPAVFIDAAAATRLGARPHCEGAIFLVHRDVEPEDAQAAELLAPVYSASLPADNVDIVELLGRGECGERGERSLSGALPETKPTAQPARQPQPKLQSKLDKPQRPPWELESDYSSDQPVREGSGACLMFVPAVGGAGASITAAAFSLVLSRERPVCLVDADETAGGLDLVLGMEAAHGLRWQDFSATDGRLDGTALYEALPACPSSPALRVLTWARARQADNPAPNQPHPIHEIAETINCLIRAGLTVIVDCPKQPEYFITLGAVADETAIVVPTSVRAIAAAARLAEICAQSGFAASAVVRHQRHRDVTVEDVEYVLDLPIVGEIEYCKRVARELDVGGLAASVGKLTRGLADLFAGGVDG
ncbi:MAG: hypothetical protein Q4E11_09580 [Corynebacterium sp.]|uniref:hypothetical protein n=1 Tax=Corynebacterium sp. TaxID=1720 RepID=UPI0026DA7239|nr:hypothetical protein [Corynebacterium sp.]MDO5030810.1 hypothetical protein [Corynebacterium sp.]